jgi:hypothetical protein
VNRGDRFEELVWGTSPEHPSVASLPSPEALALAAAQEFFSATSQSRSEALAYLAGIYPPQVEYYGKLTQRSEVLQEKDTFLQRWPQRSYELREGASVNCTLDGRCVVDGLVDWRNDSAPRKATSTGTARFTLVLVLRGREVSLLGESSTVISRDVRRQR